jgi:AsmA protein
MRLKHVLIGVGAIAAGVVAAGAILLATLDPNDHRGEIEARLGAALGRSVTLGPLDLKLGLTPRLVARDIVVAGPGGEMARVGELGIALDLWSLAVGTPRIEAVTVTRAAVLFEVDAAGRSNWQISRPAAPATPAPAASGAAPNAPRPIQLDRLALADVAVTYRDLRSEISVPIIIARGESALTPGRPTPLEATGSVAGRPVQLKGTVPALDHLGTPMPVQIGGVIAGIDIAVTGTVTATEPSADLRIAVTIPTLAALSAFGAAVPPAVAALGPAKLGGRVVASGQAARVEDLAIGLAGADGADVAVTATGTAWPAIDLALTATAKEVERFPFGMPALGPLTGSGQLTGSPQVLALNQLTLAGAGTALTGALGFDLRAQRPALSATLAIDRITLPAPTPAAEPARGAAAPAPPVDRLIPATPLPLAALDQVDARVSVTLGQLVTSGGEVRDVALSAELANGVLELSRAQATVAGGKVAATGRVTRAGALQITLQGDDLQLGALGRLLARDLPIAASADLAIAVRGQGRDVRALAASLDGTANLVIGRGQIAMTAIRGLGLPQQLLSLIGQDISELRCFVIRSTLADGVATLGTVVAGLAPAVVIGQGGRVSLGDERIDARLIPRSANPLLASALPPLTVSGTLASPRFAPDGGAAVGAVTGIANLLLGQPPAAASPLPDYCAAAVAGQPLPAAAPAPAPAPATPPPAAPRPPSLPGVLDQLFRR